MLGVALYGMVSYDSEWGAPRSSLQGLTVLAVKTMDIQIEQ